MTQGVASMINEGPKVVVVVDDEPLLRMIAADCLRDDGYTVYEAGCADEALGVIDAHDDIDCLFTDIDMPGMSGLDLANEVRRRWPRVTCVVTSGRGAPQAVECALPFVAKPYDCLALSDELRSSCGRRAS